MYFPSVFFSSLPLACVLSPCRFHNIGLLVLFVLDIGDVVLELSKTIVYFKVRNDKEHYWPELFANIGFACFTLQQ